ncbi:tRNA(Met)-cytidine N(4)-acetyltransferase [Colwellia chukchiensis]|uniref:tRNA(Met) cytidine acetyltransferase TmcA n=1 Tax=Colwellia chukchiensis TaxID=641665 RepID=A0A1H7IQE6_9GAMM|nr:GNAT family N-acetyltransferase [Colwellia chukchiensis]SEK64679.1 tRNA(Met)-cytidine N(4)-acetyltransferase [Colwellia chukchiensis]
MSITQYSIWYQQLQQQALARRWRNLVVLQGDENWLVAHVELSIRQCFLASSNDSSNKEGLVYGDLTLGHAGAKLTAVDSKSYRQYLGTEQQAVVFKVSSQGEGAEKNVDIDAVAALSGTIVAGGVLLLLMSQVQGQVSNTVFSNDYFFQRFYRQIQSNHCYLIRQQDIELPTIMGGDSKGFTGSKRAGNDTSLKQKLPYGCVTQEQVCAVEAMLKVLTGHRDRPLVLTADRGRGKSTALALAATQMLLNAKQPLTIIITAANKQALRVFYSQLEQQLGNIEHEKNRIKHANGCIEFHAFDALLQQHPKAGIVMVDEAAALPVYLLQQLLAHYHRLIFASTIHGYEGAGRGFAIQFRRVLQKLRPNWRQLHIQEPIRWANDDPLEQFIFDSCLLNAQLPIYDQLETTRVSTGDVSVQRLDVAKLLDNEGLLRQIFAVLVTAHYQTSPSDLRLLLNNSAVSLFVLTRANAVLGVALLMQEGQASEKQIQSVQASQRRLRDQFIPQSLLVHCGTKDSFNYCYQRIMRIAIHPQWQRNGLGQYFLRQIEQDICAQAGHFIGASFAANASLVSFWIQAGFAVARLGFNKDQASGEHSCLVLKALDNNAQVFQTTVVEAFYMQFDHWLTDEFKQLAPTLVWQILNANQALKAKTLSPSVLHSVSDFILAQRQFSSCVYSLHSWLLKHCTTAFDPDVLPLIARILQKHSVAQVCQQYGFSGKKALTQHLINYISRHQAPRLS